MHIFNLGNRISTRKESCWQALHNQSRCFILIKLALKSFVFCKCCFI